MQTDKDLRPVRTVHEEYYCVDIELEIRWKRRKPSSPNNTNLNTSDNFPFQPDNHDPDMDSLMQFTNNESSKKSSNSSNSINRSNNKTDTQNLQTNSSLQTITSCESRLESRSLLAKDLTYGEPIDSNKMKDEEKRSKDSIGSSSRSAS